MADVIIIGSGFGGSIAAKRYTEAGYTVALLELGERWDDPAKLEQSQEGGRTLDVVSTQQQIQEDAHRLGVFAYEP